MISTSSLFSASSEIEAASAIGTSPKLTEPALDVPDLELVKPGEPVSFVATLSDTGDSSSPIQASGLPAGASFDPLANRFQWTPGPDQVGNHTVTFRANNSNNQSVIGKTQINVGWGEPMIDKPQSPVCSPGTIATLNGKWLAEEERSDSSGASHELGGTRVRVNGLPAAVVFANRRRVDFQLRAQ